VLTVEQRGWRTVNAPHLVALVRASSRFHDGKLVECPDDTDAEAAATRGVDTDGTRVVLIGGTSHVGKSMVARVVATERGFECRSTDKLAKHPGG
jgi:hypothetical protein